MNVVFSMADNPALRQQDARYTTCLVDTKKILKSWKFSLFAHEWLSPDGSLRRVDDLPEQEKIKRLQVEEKIESGLTLVRPLLGIGLMENVEIGIGRAEFLTLTAMGVETLEVHIPKSNEKDFKNFQALVR